MEGINVGSKVLMDESIDMDSDASIRQEENFIIQSGATDLVVDKPIQEFAAISNKEV